MFLNMVIFSFFFFIFFASFPTTHGDVYTTINYPLLVGYLSSLTSNRTHSVNHHHHYTHKHHFTPNTSPRTQSASPRTNSHNNNQLHTITGVNATGLGITLPGFVESGVPSDSNGAVGTKYYVQGVNSNFGIFDKTTGLLVGAFIPPLAPWSGIGGHCDPTSVDFFTSDPIVMYDRLADRWVLSILALNFDSNSSFSHCIAVSVTSDPRGAYYQYEIQFGQMLPDYPKGSTWPDGYYFTYNNFIGNLTAGVTVCALDRQSILRGNYHSSLLCFEVPSASSLLPSDVDGDTPPPVGSPNYLLSLDLSQCTSSVLLMYKIYLDWRFPNNSVMVGPKTITVSPYTWCGDMENIAQQPQTTMNLEAITDRLMFRLVYRYLNGIQLLLTTHSLVTVTGIPNVRWYEIRDISSSVPVAYQQGDLPNDGINRYFPSIAMDKNGNIAIGYSASDKKIFPSIYYTGRESYDPLNTTRMEKVLFYGNGSVISSDDRFQRWGDYSCLTVDPVDGCTFYYTNQYLANNQHPNVGFSTRIVSFRFEDCVSRDRGDDKDNRRITR